MRIKILNAIAPEGLALLSGRFAVAADEADPQGIVVRSSQVRVDGYPSLLAVARAGAGVNNIDVDRATERGICVFNTPGANANAVVELVFTMLGIWLRRAHLGIEFCRGLAGLDDEAVHQRVEGEKKRFRGVELAGKTLGVVGLGQIGVRVANSGLPHGMRVLGFDPNPLLDNIHRLSPRVELARSLDEVAAQADVLSLHVPLNAATRGLVSTALLARMRPEALLLNYARGPVVDQAAVLTALDAGRLQGFITDFPTAALVGHAKVLATPHLGASTEESEENCAVMAARELAAYLQYGHVSHSVNFPNADAIPSDKVRSRLIVINRDVPGMIGQVSNILGRHAINIASYLNESNGQVGYNIIDIESAVPEDVQREIERVDGVVRVRLIAFG
ncbi:MAG: 3-phosphoglycerate dehydrogenase [Desulfobulbaceae bacterium A2]|nr:MAG: 3-phosphoglycerate dehydrogenase [Desulfobulbaceae bacterium A2]